MGVGKVNDPSALRVINSVPLFCNTTEPCSPDKFPPTVWGVEHKNALRLKNKEEVLLPFTKTLLT